ncbi:hydrolase 1, exosortase A system-associated [bacterium]|nr:hydrolase 1, exosortase A system-associated [bacterium]RIK80795.1 MAG: hydrolase 1, exosortase A system-associated [candidate division KSB1 bacterium]
MEQTAQFKCDGQRLYGILHLPDRPQVIERVVLMVVGGPQTRIGSHRLYVQLARFLCMQGIAVFRFDYAGIGDSESAWRGYKFAGPSISAAIDFLFKEIPLLKDVILWSLCDGATACAVFVHHEQPRIAGMILCNPYLHSAASQAKTILRHYYGRRLLQKDFWQKALALRLNMRDSLVSFGGLVKQSQNSNGRAAAAHRPDEYAIEIHPDALVSGLASFRRPIHFLLSTADLTARQFRDFCKRQTKLQKAFKTRRYTIDYVEAADHTFSDNQAKQLLFLRTLAALNSIED